MATTDTPAPGSRRSGRANPRIDMTPMVDLGFLLITFFIFTTSMSQNFGLKLIMPKGGPDMPAAESGTLSVVLSDKGVYAYRGRWEPALKDGRVQKTTLATYTGIGEGIRQLQKELAAKGRKDGLILLIRPAKSASYTQVIDALDQALIHQVKRYAIVDADAGEEAFVRREA
jgi:biopolymer transport protein ExbD